MSDHEPDVAKIARAMRQAGFQTAKTKLGTTGRDDPRFIDRVEFDPRVPNNSAIWVHSPWHLCRLALSIALECCPGSTWEVELVRDLASDAPPVQDYPNCPGIWSTEGERERAVLRRKWREVGEE